MTNVTTNITSSPPKIQEFKNGDYFARIDPDGMASIYILTGGEGWSPYYNLINLSTGGWWLVGCWRYADTLRELNTNNFYPVTDVTISC